MSLIAIADYGMGNLASVQKAFAFIGCDAVVTSDAGILAKADAVVLPGVGAFSDAMKNLAASGLDDAVKTVIRSGKPFLGICLGLQMLFEFSEEGGSKTAGLGVVKGNISILPSSPELKVPHMGWNSLNIKVEHPLFEELPRAPYVYFVHSYYVHSDVRDIVSATADYGMEFDAAISRGNLHATQFHPEKSGEIGLTILKNFIRLVK